ncbi:SirB2 family protein [Kaarinaea lacus]
MSTIKLIHVVCALLSISGFIARGILMIRGSSLLSARTVKVLPHVNDTVLLVTAIVLASQWGWSALQMPWLLAKIIALLAYIALGMLALKPGRSQSVRISAWLAAIITFAFIVSVAVTRNPLVIF